VQEFIYKIRFTNRPPKKYLERFGQFVSKCGTSKEEAVSLILRNFSAAQGVDRNNEIFNPPDVKTF